MKFSEAWVREWSNLSSSIDSNKLNNQLTMLGFQVSGSYPVYNHKFHGIVIGIIIEYNIHPYLDNIWVIKIDNGTGNLIKIIYDKINCRKNLRIVVANVGALLPTGHIIAPIIIGQEKSEGILCTYPMLKLNHYTKSIIELPDDAPVGVNFYDYLKLNDNIINVNITPNRGDCSSILGLSREIATVNQLKLKQLKIDTIKPTINDVIPVILETPEQCPKFIGRIIKNINVSVSTPLKIQEKLYRCGVHSINVVLDIINYVLLELGYPIYVFDFDKIDQSIIYIRYSKSDEILKLSDPNITSKLFENTLIIADYYKPLAIAGIIIGNQFSVSIKTRNIFLQSAIFNSSIILKQSKLYNLHTVTSIRHAQGIDWNLSELALNYVTFLLLKICRGDAGPITIAVNQDLLPKANSIIFNPSKLDKVLGFHIQDQKSELILRNLGFQVIKIQNNLWQISSPTWRFDITTESDLISEIIRIYGYHKIPRISIGNPSLTNRYLQPTEISLSRIKTVLVDRGYREIMTYSFVDPNIQKLLHPQYIPLNLMNPISLEMSVMRLSLWTGLIKTVIYNQNRQHKHILLFESGICFIPNKNNDYHIAQKLMISGIRSGFKFSEHWDLKKSLVDFYDIKGDVESILNIMINKYTNDIIFKTCQHSALHPKQSAAIYLNKILIGYVGMIHPMILNQLGLHVATLVFELSWDNIVNFKLPMKITDISKFNKNYRDISLIVPNYIRAGDIIDVCKKINLEQLISVKLIDVYTGSSISKGYKSFTIKLTLQSKTHTLQEKEILEVVDKCIMFLKKRFHIIVR